MTKEDPNLVASADFVGVINPALDPQRRRAEPLMQAIAEAIAGLNEVVVDCGDSPTATTAIQGVVRRLAGALALENVAPSRGLKVFLAQCVRDSTPVWEIVQAQSGRRARALLEAEFPGMYIVAVEDLRTDVPLEKLLFGIHMMTGQSRERGAPYVANGLVYLFDGLKYRECTPGDLLALIRDHEAERKIGSDFSIRSADE